MTPSLAPAGSPGPPPGGVDQAPVTGMLLALCAAIFAVEVAVSRGLAITSDAELRLGASYALATIGEARWETIVTACFVHGSVVHLAINLFVLWQSGPLVERLVGSARFAPLVLLSGAFGYAVSVVARWVSHSGEFSVGASGMISAVVVAAFVVGYRMQGWRGRLTRAMAWWIGFLIFVTVLANLLGSRPDNAAHLGGAIAGGVIASAWKRGAAHSAQATRVVLVACLGTVAACVAVLSVREATSPFASMLVQQRQQYTMEAVGEGRCRDAHEGLRAVERLRGPMESLRKPVEMTCGHVEER